MNDITVHIYRTETVSPETVSKIAQEFVEWLEQEGFSVSVTLDHLRANDGYDDLGRDFARYLAEQKDGQLR